MGTGSSEGSGGKGMTVSTEKKVRACFMKLLQLLQAKNQILYDVFKAFDKEKSNNLNREEFRKMMRYMSTEM